ncbi:MAG TPA: hypothetical protein VGW75_14175 [Solirubrobacteraceae bacterium]|jgi:hypothetical protein|nr:hypothetical protein [Solirubrobacteraceae bacterium]
MTGRRLLVAETVDDYAVALAAAVADGALGRWAPVLGGVPVPGAASLHEAVVAGEPIAPERWRELSELWYRWQAPRDHVSPMRWYFSALAAAAGLAPGGEEAAELVDRWLQEQEAAAPAERAARVRAILGVDGTAPLVAGCGDPLDALAGIAHAAVRGRPFVWFPDAGALAEALAAEGRGEAFVAAPSRAAASVRAATGEGAEASRGAPLAGAAHDGGGPLAREARDAWAAMEPGERDALLLRLHDAFAILGPVRVRAAGRALDNDSGRELVAACIGAPPAAWSHPQLVWATCLRLWQESAAGFTELNQADLALAELQAFLVHKRARYVRLLGAAEPAAAPASLVELAQAVATLREEVERDHVRCFAIDGGSWERREHFVPLRDVMAGPVPHEYTEHLERTVGVPLPEGPTEAARFDALVERMAARGVNPAEALVATAHFVVADEALDADYVVVTAARGVKLDRPWTLELTDVMSYTAIRPGCDPGPRGVRLGDVQIRTAISQRMRYNVTRRARNYSPDRDERLTAQPFQFPDVAAGEDAHHGGHRANGIRLVARAPFVLDLPGGKRWRGLADVRINRVSYKDADRFVFEDLPRLIRRSLWCRAIVEATYARGLCLDERYGNKQVAVPPWAARELAHA